MKLIETERTRLRPFIKRDLGDVLQLLGNPEVMRFSLSGPYSKKQCEEFIAWCQTRYELKGYGLYAVIDRSSEEVIGYCGFYDQNIDENEEVEIGYRLLLTYWNQGIGTEVAFAVQDYGFRNLGFDRLISIIEAENVGSIRIAEENGMTHEKDSLFKKKVPIQIYSILKEKHIQSSHTTPASAPR